MEPLISQAWTYFGTITFFGFVNWKFKLGQVLLMQGRRELEVSVGVYNVTYLAYQWEIFESDLKIHLLGIGILIF